MMGEYFYIVSSLPFLRLREAPQITSSELQDICDRGLSQGDHSQFLSASLNIQDVQPENVHNETLKRWIVFENSLRSELVQLRAQQQGTAPDPHLRTELPWDPSVVPSLREMTRDGSPLDLEDALLEVRWRFLTDMETGHYFDLDALVIYALKLQILERMSSFDTEAGGQILEKIIGGSYRDHGDERHDSSH
jgi:hypothetical protein